jgi:hypothetical protein
MLASLQPEWQVGPTHFSCFWFSRIPSQKLIFITEQGFGPESVICTQVSWAPLTKTEASVPQHLILEFRPRHGVSSLPRATGILDRTHGCVYDPVLYLSSSFTQISKCSHLSPVQVAGVTNMSMIFSWGAQRVVGGDRHTDIYFQYRNV